VLIQQLEIANGVMIARVMIAMPEGLGENSEFYLMCARLLRENAIPVELYVPNDKLGKQMQYADKKGFLFVVIARTEHINNGVVCVRNLQTGDQIEVPLDTLPKAIADM
jgi:histidyl-tRNA synthetase